MKHYYSEEIYRNLYFPYSSLCSYGQKSNIVLSHSECSRIMYKMNEWMCHGESPLTL